MNLDQFLIEQREKLEKFEAYWKDANQLDSNNYPSELGAGDWDVQLEVFDPEWFVDIGNGIISAVVSSIELATGIEYNRPVDVNSWIDCDLGCDLMATDMVISRLEALFEISISEDDLEAKMDTQYGITDITILELARLVSQKVKERNL